MYMYIYICICIYIYIDNGPNIEWRSLVTLALLLDTRNLSQGTADGYEISILSLAHPFVGEDLQQKRP